MITIALTGLVTVLAGTVAVLVRDRNRYRAISNDTIKELAILEKEYDELVAEVLEAGAEIIALEKDRDYWMNMAVDMTDRYIDESGVLDDPEFWEKSAYEEIEKIINDDGDAVPMSAIADWMRYLTEEAREEFINSLSDELRAELLAYYIDTEE